jgi:hypothetical protein
MSEASRRDEDKRRRSQSLGDLAREIFGEVPVMDNNPPPSATTYQQGYSMPSVPLRGRELSIDTDTIIKGLGWSIVALLATSYVFLLLAGSHSPFALLPASVWIIIYLVSFAMGVIYETGLSSDMLSDIGIVLFFVLLNTWPAIPLIITMLFFPHYVPIFLGIGIAQPSGFLAVLALIALINSL